MNKGDHQNVLEKRIAWSDLCLFGSLIIRSRQQRIKLLTRRKIAMILKEWKATKSKHFSEEVYHFPLAKFNSQFKEIICFVTSFLKLYHIPLQCFKLKLILNPSLIKFQSRFLFWSLKVHINILLADINIESQILSTWKF